MNAELPLFKNGEHNTKSVSTIDRVTTLVMMNETTVYSKPRTLKPNKLHPQEDRWSGICFLSDAAGLDQ